MNFDIESIKSLMDGLDPAALLPEISSIVDVVRLICRIGLLAAPVVLLVLGLCYLLFPAKEANYFFGYRTAFGMGSVSAWRYTQKVAGAVFAVLGGAFTVIMFFTGAGFGSMDAMDMVWKTVQYLITEAVVFALANLAIGSLAAFTFDFSGNKRKK